MANGLVSKSVETVTEELRQLIARTWHDTACDEVVSYDWLTTEDGQPYSTFTMVMDFDPHTTYRVEVHVEQQSK